MGQKGKSTGLKRKKAPRFWPIRRKEFVWVVKPSVGPHSTENCLPLTVVLRDILGIAKTRKEAKTMLSQGKVYVDGKARYKDDFPVGLMDIISIPEVNKHFRVLPSKNVLTLHSIGQEETKFKLCRIEDKKVVKKGHVQLNLNDGSNILVKVADSKNPQEDIYQALDTLKVSLPEREILERVEMKENAHAIITGGKNIGIYGRIVEIEKTQGKKRRDALTTVQDERNNRYQTILNFVFALGDPQLLISLAEVAQIV